MAGGTFNYSQLDIQDKLEEIAEYIASDCPKVSKVLEKLSQVLTVCLTQIDEHLAGDIEIKDLARWDRYWSAVLTGDQEWDG